MNKLVLIAGILLLLMPSCNKNNYLSNSEKDALFANPAAAEPDYIFNEWQNRNLAPTDYTVLQQEQILSGKFILKIVSFNLNGFKEYGALLIPNTINKIPVQVWVGGFGLDITTNSINLAFDDSNAVAAHILAIPALRGQSLALTLNGIVYTSPVSEGIHCDAFDGATDDVLAFLNLIEQTETHADVDRTGVRGGSRGGTVALLAGIRDKRIKRVVAVAGPTDMFELTSQSANDPTYQCQFLAGFKNSQSTLAEARNKMLASSPVYFAEHLPLTQMHMGLNDKNVPVSQGYDLEKKMVALGNAAEFQLFTYDKTHSDIATNNTDLAARIEQFLSQL